MESLADAQLRIELAEGHLREADRELGISEWRAASASAQLSAENAAKAAMALRRPVPHTHDVEDPLRQQAARLPQGEERELVLRLASAVQGMGSRLHAELRYGNEEERLTPWQLFPEERGRALVGRARQALDLVRQLVELRRQK